MAEQQTLTPEQQNELLFMQLVVMFQTAALQHMGKMMNPVTQKVERDLAQAKNAIDILGMLEAKTKGNLGENESKMLEHALFELRMNYVDEVNKGEEKQEDSAAPEGEKQEDAPGGDEATDEASEGEGVEDEEAEAGESS